MDERSDARLSAQSTRTCQLDRGCVAEQHRAAARRNGVDETSADGPTPGRKLDQTAKSVTLRVGPLTQPVGYGPMPLGSQGRRKADKRAADMTMHPPPEAQTAARWTRPPAEECEENSYTMAVDDSTIDRDRIQVRLLSHCRTDALAEFALIQQTYEHGKWHDVAVGDSCHDTDVHVHRYARSTGQRVGDPEILMPVTSQADLHRGYDEVLGRIADCWEANREAWKHG